MAIKIGRAWSRIGSCASIELGTEASERDTYHPPAARAIPGGTLQQRLQLSKLLTNLARGGALHKLPLGSAPPQSELFVAYQPDGEISLIEIALGPLRSFDVTITVGNLSSPHGSPDCPAREPQVRGIQGARQLILPSGESFAIPYNTAIE